MTENEIGKIVVDAAIAVHRALGSAPIRSHDLPRPFLS